MNLDMAYSMSDNCTLLSDTGKINNIFCETETMVTFQESSGNSVKVGGGWVCWVLTILRLDTRFANITSYCCHTAWSDSVIGPLWSNSVIKLVLVLFGKCTTLVVTKC